MLGLAWLDPIWLWGLAAVLVPIAIHFFSRGPARTILVGSVAMIAPSASRRARRLKLTEKRLAALRALLLALVALALAGPLRERSDADDTVGLVEPALLANDAWRSARPDVAARLDELAAVGRLRSLAPGFRVASNVAVRVADPARSTTEAESGSVSPDVWSLLREVSNRLPRGTRIEVFTRGAIAELGGVRPMLDAEVAWHVVPPEPSAVAVRHGMVDGTPTVWRARLSADGIRVARGPSETALPETALPETEEPASAQRPARVLIAAESARHADRDYVTAALEAVDSSGWVDVEVVHRASEPSAFEVADGERDFDLAFWLAAEPLPEAWRAALEAPAIVVEDAVGDRYRECPGSVMMPGAVPGALPGASSALLPGRSGEIMRRRCADDEAPSTDLVFVAGRHLTLDGRFHPAWSDLVLDPAFPRWLARMLDQARGETVRFADPRLATAADRQPSRNSADAVQSAIRAALEGLDPTSRFHPWLWTLIGLALVAERLVARKGATS